MKTTPPSSLRLLVTSFIICLASLSAFAADTQQERMRWLFDQMEMAESIKPGATSERLLELFVPERGVTHGADGKHAWTYWLKSCRILKVDVQFEELILSSFDLKPGNKIKWISKPYLQRENIG